MRQINNNKEYKSDSCLPVMTNNEWSTTTDQNKYSQYK